MCMLHFCTNMYNYVILPLPISYLLQLFSLVQTSFSVSWEHYLHWEQLLQNIKLLYILSGKAYNENHLCYSSSFLAKLLLLSSEQRQREKRNEECNYREIQRFALETSFSTLTRVGVRVAVCFGPLVRRGLLVEVILRLHQRERVWEERPTAHGLMVPQPTVTAAFLRPIRQVKRDAPLRL